MARFIEVTPFNFGGEKHRILINVEKIDYVQEIDEDVTSIHLSDVPLSFFWGEGFIPQISTCSKAIYIYIGRNRES